MTTTNTIEHAVAIAYSFGQPYGQTIASEELVAHLHSLVDTPATGVMIYWTMPSKFGGKQVKLLEFTTSGTVREASRDKLLDLAVNDELHGEPDSLACRLARGEFIAA